MNTCISMLMTVNVQTVAFSICVSNFALGFRKNREANCRCVIVSGIEKSIREKWTKLKNGMDSSKIKGLHFIFIRNLRPTLTGPDSLMRRDFVVFKSQQICSSGTNL